MNKSKKFIFIAGILIIVVGIGIFLYPTISNQIALNQAKNTISEFNQSIQNIQDGSFKDPQNQKKYKKGRLVDNESDGIKYDFPVLFKEDLNRLKVDSIAYNNRLKTNQNLAVGFEYCALDLTNYGIYSDLYGYIEAPDIDLMLPIFLGASEWNMSCGAVHLNETSLPVGGIGTNVVLAGHTAYTGRTFFDDIRYLDTGDPVIITNYFGQLKYKVRYSKVISSLAGEEIYVDKEKELLSLITCENGGQDRLLVVCERVNY